MPFTFAHPAIVLPIHKAFRHRVSLTGLIIGSLTPDFEYFINMKIQGYYGHSLLGVWWFCLPMGLALCFIFHLIVKRPLIDNAPYWIQARLGELRQSDWLTYFKRHWFVVCLSLVVGAYSHLLWDAFTHRHGFFSQQLGLTQPLFYLSDLNVPSLNVPGLNVPGLNMPVPIYKVLQHASTLIGTGIMLAYFCSLPIRTNAYRQPKISFWLSIAVCALIIFSIRAYYGLSLHAYGNIIVSAISAGMLAVIVVCGYEMWSQKYRTSKRE